MSGDNLPAHFYLAPSSSGRWIPCPASLRVCADIPDEAGEAAERGTLGHHLVEIDVKGLPLEQPERDQLEALPDAVRQELEDHVDLCVDLVSDSDADFKLYETKIQSNLLEEHGGTVDVLEYWNTTKTLQVTDFKFGRVKVDVEGNRQIKCYINLARQMFPDAERFIGRIIQPVFSDKPFVTTFSLDELLQHEADVLEASISDHFKAGDHCQWCPYGGQCETLAKYLRGQVSMFPDLTQLVGSVKTRPTDDQIEQLCKIYKTYKLAEKATEGAGDILKRWAREGANIQTHGLGLRVTYRAKWGEGAAERLTEEIGDAYKEPQLITPKEARELLGMTKDRFEDEFSDVLDSTEVRSLVMGRGQNEFPEFD